MLIDKTHVIHTFLGHRFDYIVQIVNVLSQLNDYHI